MAQQELKARKLYRVKPGRALVFPGVPTENNQHLWARGGEVVDATHPLLARIVELTPHLVAEIDEAELTRLEDLAAKAAEVQGRKPVAILSLRMHASMKVKIREYDVREKEKPAREAANATAKAERLGVDPKTLPKATRG